MKGGLRTGRFPEACSRQSAEIPPRGVARRKTRVLRRGGAAWPAGPLSHGSSVSSRRLAGAEPPPLLASVRSQPYKGLRVCGPSCPTAAGSRAAPAGREPRLGEAGAELRAGLQAAGGPRKNSLRAARTWAASAKPSPAREARCAAPGGGTSEAQSPGSARSGVGLRTQGVSAGRGLGSPRARLLWAPEEEGAGLGSRSLTSRVSLRREMRSLPSVSPRPKTRPPPLPASGALLPRGMMPLGPSALLPFTPTSLSASPPKVRISK